MSDISIIGAGSWGTALSVVLHKNGHKITIWSALAPEIEMLKEKGAKSVYVACTHPVFSGPAVERLQNSSADEVVVTDTIKLPEEKIFPKLKTVSVAGLLAKTIENIENCLPVSDVFQMFDFDK